jgi:hypothetical protein
VQLFKDVLNATHACAGTVVTGSGMVALLKAVADARVNGFMLWGAADHLRVGQEPAPAVALAMAQRLHSVYAPSWPPEVRAHVTPQLLVDSLAFEAHAGLTSPRPALLAFLAGTLSRQATESGGSGERALQEGFVLILGKLETESRGYAAIALERMRSSELMELRELAEHGVMPQGTLLARFAAVLCEEQVVAGGPGGEAQEGQVGQQLLQALPAGRKLLPPYGTLLQRWATQDGCLSIVSRGQGQPLVPRVLQTLTTVNKRWRGFDGDLNACLAASVLQTLAENSIGVSVPRAAVRPPRTWLSSWPFLFLPSLWLRWSRLLPLLQGESFRRQPRSSGAQPAQMRRRRPSSWRTPLAAAAQLPHACAHWHRQGAKDWPH